MGALRLAPRSLRGALARVRRVVLSSIALTLVLALSACLFETAKPVFEPRDVVAPVGLSETYRLEPPASAGEGAVPLYLALKPASGGAYTATLHGIEDDEGKKTWKHETYAMRFVALEGDWFIWELASQEVGGGTARWYGLVELNKAQCRWIDSFNQEAENRIKEIAKAQGLDLRVSMGSPRVEGRLTAETLETFFKAVLAGPGAEAPMGTCAPSDLPDDLKAALGQS